MAVSILRLQESRGASPGISGMHDTLSLSLPRSASANSGAYTAIQSDGAELLASPGPGLLSMASESPRAPAPSAAAAAAARRQLAAAARAWR